MYTQKGTKINIEKSKEAEFFEIEGVYLRVRYGLSKTDLANKKNTATRDYKISISETVASKLLEIHKTAKKI